MGPSIIASLSKNSLRPRRRAASTLNAPVARRLVRLPHGVRQSSKFNRLSPAEFAGLFFYFADEKSSPRSSILGRGRGLIGSGGWGVIQFPPTPVQFSPQQICTSDDIVQKFNIKQL